MKRMVVGAFLACLAVLPVAAFAQTTVPATGYDPFLSPQTDLRLRIIEMKLDYLLQMQSAFAPVQVVGSIAVAGSFDQEAVLLRQLDAVDALNAKFENLKACISTCIQNNG